MVGVPPGDHGAIVLERRERLKSGANLVDTGAELIGYPNAVTALV